MADEMGPDSPFYYTWHGKVLATPEELRAARLSAVPVRAWPRLPGGKGGFGSLLRSIGSQIDKTTNREMCRDLSGRRMRDVNNQKRLTEWAAGAGSRAAERQKRREEKRRRRRELLESADTPAGHVMQDGRYLVEKERIVDSVFSAVQAAMKSRKRPAGDSAASASASSAATSANAAGPSRAPKAIRKWLDADLQGLEGSSSSSSSTSSSSGDSGGEEPPSADAGPSPDADDRASAEAAPGEHEAAPGEHDATPGEYEAAPEELEAAPGEHEAAPKEHESAPREHEAAPKEHESAPKEHEAAPKEHEAAPKEHEVAPKEHEVAPKEHEAAPEEKLCDLSEIGSLEVAERLGLDVLKTQLRLRGLKCSGSLRERAQRLLAVRGLAPDRYPKALLAVAAPARPEKK